ncbi:MAG: cytidine deaminase [Anaerolineae bacterium]|nr:cytidine deaminase [Anaerolineae bacterium]
MAQPNILSPDQYADLLKQAIEARNFAYVPYSNYKVGAALLTADGRVYQGCNVENAAYGPSMCAERVAVFKAVSEGVSDFVAIAVATVNGGTPCGVCRQVLREFAPELTVIIGDVEGNYKVFTLSDLLPHSFGPEHLLR